MTIILVVDDEKVVARTVERILEGEYQVHVAYNGADALKIARRISPSLIILDIIMPGMDGLETCRELRSDPLLKSVPVLFLTGKGRPEERVEGLEAGADDYLAKPFDVRELLLRVKAILRRTSPGVRPVTPPASGTCLPLLEVGDLTLNCSNFQLSTPQTTVQLTPVEFDLLYHLMTHPGQVFSSSQLLRDLWGYPGDAGSPDLVRVHIRNLRRKIEADSSHPSFIRTVSRHGYTVLAE